MKADFPAIVNHTKTLGAVLRPEFAFKKSAPTNGIDDEARR